MAAKKTALVVGGTNGIGKAIAANLAARGVATVIAGRSRDKTEAVAREIGAAAWLVVDVNQQADVGRFAAEVASTYAHLDYLVLTAAQLFNSPRLNADGVQELLALNHLWRFQLTGLLKDVLAAAPDGARVLNVGGAGRNADVFFDDPNFQRRGFSVIAATGQAQQLNDVLAVEAQRRWGGLGHGIQFHVVMPGMVNSHPGKSIDAGFLFSFMYNWVLHWVKKTPEATAVQLVPLLLDPVGARGGKLWDAPNNSSRPVVELTPAARVVDPAYIAKCWALCESLIKA